ncbi:MAG: extracellular solute-binding protein [Bauldia sp.]|nr:extracellular solute-binding protein [Bauldia sp.]
MTWSHPRGYDPMVACSALWKDKTGVEIAWDKRSLQDFESYPVEELAARYDFVVIDHPHVGQITDENCLLPLDDPGRAEDIAALATGSVGGSFESYRWNGHLWAFPIDAAAQVQAWRPDLLAAPARSWDGMMTLAKEGRVQCPLLPPHSLMAFFTLAGNLGSPCASGGPGDLISVEAGRRVLGVMHALFDAIDPDCLTMDPIDVFERMSKASSTIACVPLIYGYVGYAMDGFRERVLSFADIPVAGADGPVGSAIGGTGIAVSARSAHPREAIDFAYWIASGAVQQGPYAAAGGQPGHAAAWEADAVNAATGSFYRNTRASLEGGWVRPRHDGYVAFQQHASERINLALRDGGDDDAVIADLNSAFRESFR